jgi:C_GCAxxG_C_C family probable redox protein
MTPEEMKERARELFRQCMHCSQAVLAAGLEKIGRQEPELIRAVGSYGGGIASSGRTCGCLLGGVALISLMHSKSRPDEPEDVAMWKLSSKLNRAFDELCREYGGTDCADIAQVNWRDRDQVKEFYGNSESRRRHCMELVGRTARTLGELLDQGD